MATFLYLYEEQKNTIVLAVVLRSERSPGTIPYPDNSGTLRLFAI
jgi:hypothetical protein